MGVVAATVPREAAPPRPHLLPLGAREGAAPPLLHRRTEAESSFLFLESTFFFPKSTATTSSAPRRATARLAAQPQLVLPRPRCSPRRDLSYPWKRGA
nr:unnamed protein product [Digitaria exilis]